MEARDYITAREMLSDGNWLLTTMNGLPRYEKPPLPTWLAAIAGFVFGKNSLWAMRLPSVFLVLITSVYTFILSEKAGLNRSHSLINGLIAATSFYVTGIILEAPWDIFTHGFMLVAIVHLFQLFSTEEEHRWRHAVVAGIFLGLSFMSKGPVSMYALLLPFIPAYGITYKFHNMKRKIIPLMVIIILMIIIGGWWYLYVRLMDPLTFLKIAKRETGNWSGYNVRPLYYYWSFFAQSGLWTIPALVGLFYPYLKKRVSNLNAYRFSLLWTLFSVVLLSLVPEKKSRYLMPVLIPLAINTGFYIEYVIRSFKKVQTRPERLPVYFNFGIFAVAGFVVPVAVAVLMKEQLSYSNLYFVIAGIVFPSMSVIVFIQLARGNMKKVFYGTVCIYLLIFVLVVPLLKPLLNTHRDRAEQFKTMVKQENLKVYGYNYIPPEIIWMYGQKIPMISNLDTSAKSRNMNEKTAVLTNVKLSGDNFPLQTKDFRIKLLDTLDLNSPGRNNSRLKSFLYVLEQKSSAEPK
jgi:4-amino-4-deoxy-L-arabinose transferase-like glycosyltransferase